MISSQHPIQKVEDLFIYQISARCIDLQIDETVHPYASHGCDNRSGLEKPPGASHPPSLVAKLGTVIQSIVEVRGSPWWRSGYLVLRGNLVHYFPRSTPRISAAFVDLEPKSRWEGALAQTINHPNTRKLVGIECPAWVSSA